MILQRRSFLLGLGSLFAAPAIVRAQNIMPVRVIVPDLPSFGYESFDQHPSGMNYQWFNEDMVGEAAARRGWSVVPATRYAGQFKTAGARIEIGGSVLMEKRAEAVIASRAADVRKAHQLIEKWRDRYAEFDPRITEFGR